MRVRRLLFLLAFGFAGCHEPTAPDVSLLVGAWTTSPSVSRFDGSTSALTLSFRSDGTYQRTWRMQDASGAPRSYAATEGTFAVRGDSIFMRATLARAWDRDFNGGAVTTTLIEAPSVDGGARFELQGQNLTLHFLSYPADAAVETTEVFARMWLAS